jgi:hypothetical protein
MVRQAAGLAFTATRTDESRSALQEAKKDESDFPRDKAAVPIGFSKNLGFSRWV